MNIILYVSFSNKMRKIVYHVSRNRYNVINKKLRAHIHAMYECGFLYGYDIKSAA